MAIPKSIQTFCLSTDEPVYIYDDESSNDGEENENDSDSSTNTSVDSDNDISVAGDASDCNTGNGLNVVDTPTYDNVYDGYDVDDAAASHDTSMPEEASNCDRNDAIDVADAAPDNDEGAAVENAIAASPRLERIVRELDIIRARLERIEAKFYYDRSSIDTVQASSTTGVPIKRKRNDSVRTPPKKQRLISKSEPSSLDKNEPYEVNIRTGRAWLQLEGMSMCWEYTWKRSRGKEKGCWMRDLERCNREEVDGGYLLCYPSELFIEVRANADWLPLVVQWNEKAGVFEGLDGIDGRRLEVDAAVMIDVMCGGVGQHVGFVYEGRQR